MCDVYENNVIRYFSIRRIAIKLTAPGKDAFRTMRDTPPNADQPIVEFSKLAEDIRELKKKKCPSLNELDEFADHLTNYRADKEWFYKFGYLFGPIREIRRREDNVASYGAKTVCPLTQLLEEVYSTMLSKMEITRVSSLRPEPKCENPTCTMDHEGSSFPTCKSCGLVRYCSRNCQLEHWKDHKPICKEYRLHANRNDDTILRQNSTECTRRMIRLDEHWKFMMKHECTDIIMSECWILARELYDEPLMFVQLNLAKVGDIGTRDDETFTFTEFTVKVMTYDTFWEHIEESRSKELYDQMLQGRKTMEEVSRLVNSDPDKYMFIIVGDTSHQDQENTFPIFVTYMEVVKR